MPATSAQQPLSAVLRGTVADTPQRNDFAQEFPLQIERTTLLAPLRSVPYGGRVWVRAPLGSRLGVGDRVELRGELTDVPRVGNLGEREAARRWIIESCWCLFHVKQNTGTGGNVAVVERGMAFPLLRAVAHWRIWLLNHYEDAFARTGQPYPDATAQLLCAMVFGEGGLREPLPFAVREEFRAAGLSHLLVASGTQVSLCVAILLGAARLFGVRRAGLLLAVLPALFLYAALAGSSASIWRASLAGVGVTLALLCGRRIDPLSLWCWALVAILAADPAQAWSLSLQLTFAATWGLLCLAPLLQKSLARLAGHVPASILEGENEPRGYVLELVSLSLGAQLATLPLLLFQFGRISATGMAANLLAVPLSGALVVLGVVGLVLPVARLNFALTTGIHAIAHWAATGPGARAQFLPLAVWHAFALVGGFTLLLLAPAWWDDARVLGRHLWQERRRKWLASGVAPAHVVGRGLVVTVCCLMLWCVWATWHSSRQEALVQLTALDVGQGESLVIRVPSGRTVLIDGGTLDAGERSDIGRSVIVPYLQSVGVERLDAVVLTHDDADHLSGLPTVLREVPVGMILDGAPRPGALPSPEYQAVLNIARQRNVPRTVARAGQTLDLGGGATLSVLWPTSTAPTDADNEHGVVMRLNYGSTSALLTADTGAPTEAALAKMGAPLRCTILKVGHHGSAGSSTAEFLARVQPRIALISCGRYNPFGHPTPEVLARLAQQGIATFRTDRNGEVTVSCDGHDCQVQTYR